MKINRIRVIQTMLLIVVICILSSSKSVLAAQTKSYDISKGNITIDKSGDYTITGKTDKNTITIKKGVSTNITIRDLEISITEFQKKSVLIEGGGAANFIIKGSNKITNQFNDGIHVKSGGKFIVSSYSTGSLLVTGGLEGSGIGGSGTIIIKGGTINATGGQYGYGIGSGASYHLYLDSDDEAGSITINGGKVTAIGGKEAAGGIGYSSKKSIGSIEINGGTVYATSGGSGIGSHASEGKGNKIKISGGNVTALGSAYGAGIGNSLNTTGTSVHITGGTVKANGGLGTDMYDSWSYSNDYRTRESRQEYDIAAKSITITGGQIFADTCSEQPKNSEGQKLYPMLIQSEIGKVTKIIAYQKSYGSKDINSQGILSLWLPRLENKFGIDSLDVTFSSGKHTVVDYLSTSDILQGYSGTKDMVFNISSSNLDVYTNGVIYKNKIYRTYGPIKVTGSSSKNQIIVHSGKHRFEFENVSVDYTKQTDKEFFIAGGTADVIINSKNQNTIKTGGKSVGFYVGANAKLSFASSSMEGKLSIESYDDSYGIATAKGSIQQYGGTISMTSKQNAIGIYLGNEGSFSLYNGKIEGSSSSQNAIYGLNYMRVNVYGGIMNMDNIGYHEEGNEEVYDISTFHITNGEVNISNRMIFNTFEITGGTINAHLLGSGRGSGIIMYQGKIVMDKYITNYMEISNEEIGYYFKYITPEGVSKESALDTSTIYGGEIIETHNVTVEEIEKISFGKS